jgi:hypothetical protein
LSLLGLLILQPSLVAALTTTQIDDFTDATLQGWQMGRIDITSAYMTSQTSGGPAGTGDGYLEVVADRALLNGAGGNRLTFFNKSQWTGDYLSAGITAIAVDLNNFGSDEVLNLRLGIDGLVGGLFATTAAVSLDSGSGWVHAVFSLAPGDLTPVSGQSNVTGYDAMAALGSVRELRILNSAVPDWNGLKVSATLGIDNIRAVPLPPAAALFGSGLLALLTRRRRKYLQV